MSTQTSDAPIPGTEQDDANLRLNRRRLLLTGSAVAATPAIGSQMVQPAAAQTPPQRFAYPTDRETKNAARALALEVAADRKGRHHRRRPSTRCMDVLRQPRWGLSTGQKLVARAWVDPAFKDLLVSDTMAAVAQFGFPKVWRRRGRAYARCRQHARGSQPHHLHPCAPAIPGRCWACRPTGTRTPRSGRGRRASRARFSRSSASTSTRRRRSGPGIRARPDPLVRGAGTAGRHRRHERGGPRQARHRRGHDGCRACVNNTTPPASSANSAYRVRRSPHAQSRFEHFAVTSMMAAADHPPRADGALQFSREWERTAFAVALALSRDGHFRNGRISASA